MPDRIRTFDIASKKCFPLLARTIGMMNNDIYAVGTRQHSAEYYLVLSKVTEKLGAR